jgi:hypothetical protein
MTMFAWIGVIGTALIIFAGLLEIAGAIRDLADAVRHS